MRLLCLLFSLILTVPLYAGQWNFEFEKEGIRVYTSKVDGSNFKPFRGEMEVNATIDELLAVIEDVGQYHTWCYRTTKVSLHKINSDTVIYHYISDTPPMVKNREAWFKNYKVYNEQTGAVTVMMLSFNSNAPVPRGYLRMDFSNGFWELTPITPATTKVVFQMHANPGGSIPSWLANMASVDSPVVTMRNLMLKVRGNR